MGRQGQGSRWPWPCAKEQTVLQSPASSPSQGKSTAPLSSSSCQVAPPPRLPPIPSPVGSSQLLGSQGLSLVPCVPPAQAGAAAPTVASSGLPPSCFQASNTARSTPSAEIPSLAEHRSGVWVAGITGVLGTASSASPCPEAERVAASTQEPPGTQGASRFPSQHREGGPGPARGCGLEPALSWSPACPWTLPPGSGQLLSIICSHSPAQPGACPARLVRPEHAAGAPPCSR